MHLADSTGALDAAHPRSWQWRALGAHWEACLARAGFQQAALERVMSARRLRWTIRLSDLMTEAGDPARFLEGAWAAAGEYGLVELQWWSPRLEARLGVNGQGLQQTAGRPNAMEIDCAKTGTTIQYSDPTRVDSQGRGQWRLCVPVPTPDPTPSGAQAALAGGGVLSFLSWRRFTLEESDALEQAGGFLARTLQLLDQRVRAASGIQAQARELQQSLDVLTQEVEARKRNEALQAGLFQIARLAGDSRQHGDFHAQVHRTLDGLIRVDAMAVLLENDPEPDGERDARVEGSDATSPDDGRTKATVDARRPQNNARPDGLAAPTERNTPTPEDTLAFAYFSQRAGQVGAPDPDHLKTLALALSRQAMTRTTGLMARKQGDLTAGEGRGQGQSWLAAPLMDDGHPLGALCVMVQGGDPHTPGDLDVLNLCAQQVAHALHRQRYLARLEAKVAERTAELQKEVSERTALQRQAQHQALHDPLTGLPNRRHLETRLDQALARCTASATGKAGADSGSSAGGTVSAGLALLFIDLDRFKHVNDTLGHAAGDEVLAAVARRLRARVRPTDFVARLSGDEFIVLVEWTADTLPGDPATPDNGGRGHLPPGGDARKVCETAEQRLTALCERLIDSVNAPVEWQGERAQVGASIGWTCIQGGHVDADLTGARLLASADQAMYAAKQAGRGRAVRFNWHKPAGEKHAAPAPRARTQRATPARTETVRPAEVMKPDPPGRTAKPRARKKPAPP